MADLSKFFERKASAKAWVKGFTVTSKVSPRKQPEDIEDYRDVSDDDDSGTDVDYIDYMNEDDIVEATDLKRATNELITHNKYFIEQILENLLKNFYEKMPANILTRKLFPLMKIHQLLDLHRDLARELEVVRVSYVEIGRVFDSFQDRYLVFCSVTAKANLMRQFLVDQMVSSEQLRLIGWG